MEYLDILKNRYTTKKYDSSKKISEDKMNKLKEVLNLSISSINSQPWKFVIVENKEVKGKLAEASFFNKAKIEDAHAVVVFKVMADREVFEREAWNYLDKGYFDYYISSLKVHGEDVVKKWMINQVYIAMGQFVLGCAMYDVDCTPMEGITPSKYDEILPDKDYKTVMAVAIGYRDEEDGNQVKFKPKSRRGVGEVVEVIK